MGLKKLQLNTYNNTMRGNIDQKFCFGSDSIWHHTVTFGYHRAPAYRRENEAMDKVQLVNHIRFTVA